RGHFQRFGGRAHRRHAYRLGLKERPQVGSLDMEAQSCGLRALSQSFRQRQQGCERGYQQRDVLVRSFDMPVIVRHGFFSSVGLAPMIPDRRTAGCKLSRGCRKRGPGAPMRPDMCRRIAGYNGRYECVVTRREIGTGAAMRLRVLGCSGGIGGRQNRTTSFLVDQDILIDAGTGVGDLSLAELTSIDHIFITHSHLDHVNSIAFFVDSVGMLRPKPVTVYATGPTIETLKKHLFNWDIWPDFTVIPTPEQPWLRYEEIEVGRVVDLGGRKITALPAIHTVPAVGYLLDS